MKLVAFILLLSISTVCCKKEHTCTCISKLNGTKAAAAQTTAKIKKKDAESWCAAGNTSTTYVTITTEIVCALE